MHPREAMFWRPTEDGLVACELCAQLCTLRDGRYGLCGARRAAGGKLHAVGYGRLVAANVDPIEKKPLFHFQPGSRSFSVATRGCNLRCDFCQNFSISQDRAHDADGMPEGEYVPPERIVERAAAAGCASISYTYTEPTVFYEYCRDAGVLARAEGLANCFVTNGMMMPAVVDDAAASFLDGANVDLKSFSEEFYRSYCKGSLAAVLRGIERMVERGIWVEVTTLVIPGRNDSEREIREIARYLASLRRDLPWHLSRFHPDFRAQDVPPTPASTLLRAREIGLAEGLLHVYVGNLRTEEGQSTTCTGCGALLIERAGFSAAVRKLSGGRCTECGLALAGIGLP